MRCAAFGELERFISRDLRLQLSACRVLQNADFFDRWASRCCQWNCVRRREHPFQFFVCPCSLKIMWKLLVASLAISISSACLASGWELIAGSDVSDIYIGQDSSSGEAWEVDVLIDLKKPQKVGRTFLSSVDRMEFNCRTSMVRTLSMKNHAGPMATGSVTFENRELTGWKSIEVTSINSVLLEVGCEKRKSWL